MNNRQLAILLLCSAIITASFLFGVEEGKSIYLRVWKDYSFPDICTFNRLFHHDCPGCGLTRSFIAISGGEWGRAWDYNRVGFFIYLLVLVQIPYRLYGLRRPPGREPRGAGMTTIGIYLGAGLLFLNWLVNFGQRYFFKA